MAGLTFVAEARSEPGYALYDLGDYPGLVRAGADQHGVAGEIWSVDTAALRRLDDFEGVDEGLYTREPIRLRPPHDELAVDVYLYAGPVAGKRLLGPLWTE